MHYYEAIYDMTIKSDETDLIERLIGKLKVELLHGIGAHRIGK